MDISASASRSAINESGPAQRFPWINAQEWPHKFLDQEPGFLIN